MPRMVVSTEFWRERLVDAIEKSGRDHKTLSLDAGLGETYVRDFVQRKTTPTIDKLLKLCAALGFEPRFIFGEEHLESDSIANALIAAAPEGLPYGGIVEAGSFRAVDLLNQADEGRRVALPMHPAFSKARQFAYEVRGDSMDLMDIKDGMWAVVADFGDYVEYYGQPGNGAPVVVQRTREGGHERELTIKALRKFKDHMRLEPQSSNPIHQPLVVYPERDAQIEVRILGIVLWAGRVFGA